MPSTALFARLVLAAALCAPLSLPLHGQSAAAQVLAAPRAIVIDGQSADWPSPNLVRDAKSGAAFAFLNDGRDLYILMIIDRPETRESLESSGLSVLARVGRSKSSRGVLFLTRPVPAETYIRWHESQGVYLTAEEKAKLRDLPEHDLLLTFAIGPTGSVYGPLRRLRDSEPPGFGALELDGRATYELRIPLASPDLVPGGLGARPGDPVRVTFEWGGKARKLQGTKAVRETPPGEKGDLSGSGETWAQEFLNAFDSLSRPSMDTRRFKVAIEVELAEAK